MKRQSDIPTWILWGCVGVAVIMILMILQDGLRNSRRDALLTDLHSGKLSTADAFQNRCGKALAVHTDQNVTTLSYWSGDLHIRLEENKPIGYFRVRAVPDRHGNYRDVESVISEDFALEHLACI